VTLQLTRPPPPRLRSDIHKGYAVFSALVIATTTFLASASFAAVEPTEAEVRAWLEAEIERAVKLDLPAPFAVKWTYEDYNVLTGDELAALRTEVAGKPFHPRRPELEAAERQVREGRTLIHMLWLRDDGGRWRFGIEYPGLTTRDTGYGPSQSWRLTDGTLKLYDQSIVEAGNDPTQSPKSEESIYRSDLQAIFFGSLSTTRAFNIGIKEMTVSGARWRALFEPESASTTVSLSIEYTGRWDEEAKRGFVERMHYVRHPQSQFQGQSEVFEVWERLGGESGPWAATSVSRLNAAARLWRKITGVSLVQLSEADQMAALEVPKQGSMDLFRGEIVIKEAADYTTGVVTNTSGANSGEEVTRTIPGFSTARGPGWRTLIGWSVLGAIGVIVVLFSIRRFGQIRTR